VTRRRRKVHLLSFQVDQDSGFRARLEPIERGRLFMPSKRFTPEQTISRLREAEVVLSQGATIPVAARG
jgi:hypothetical protein